MGLKPTRRGLLRLGAALLIAITALAAWEARRWFEARRVNARIEAVLQSPAETVAAALAVAAAPSGPAPTAGSDPGSAPASGPGPRPTAAAAELPPQLRFAQAHVLAQAAAAAPADRLPNDAALRRLSALQGDPQVGAAARFNAANLLLRQGQALQAAAQPGQALALIELAKEGYRELLRQNPEDWAARYNLERAQRLVPDPDETEDEPAGPRRGAERAATTMRGYAPGLP